MVASLCAVLSGCGGKDSAHKVRTAPVSEPTSRSFGEFEVHCNAVRSDELPSAVTDVYGITRSASRVLVNVAMLRKTAEGRTEPVDGTVQVHTRNLSGQIRDLTMRRISESGSISFIGEVPIEGEDLLVFEIAARPATAVSPYSMQFRREFSAD
jgi:hypothetical protein